MHRTSRQRRSSSARWGGSCRRVEKRRKMGRISRSVLPSFRRSLYVPSSMDKQAVRHTLDQLAAVLTLKGEQARRVRAVQHAARRELLATGRSSALEELREQVPPGLVEMLRIPGLGVAKVRQIHESLAIESLAELEAAAADGRLAALPRFGTKTAEAVRRGIASLREVAGPRLFHHARDEIERVRRALTEIGRGSW